MPDPLEALRASLEEGARRADALVETLQALPIAFAEVMPTIGEDPDPAVTLAHLCGYAPSLPGAVRELRRCLAAVASALAAAPDGEAWLRRQLEARGRQPGSEGV